MHFTPMEKASRQDLERYQWKKLKETLERAYQRTDFYRRRFDEVGFKPDDIRGWDDFREKVPIISKTDLLEDQKRKPPYGERLGLERRELAHSLLTSGTSGIGQEVYAWTMADVLPMAIGWGRLIYWSGYRPGDVHLDSLPINLTLAFPKSMIAAEHLLGVHILHFGAYPTKQKLELVRRFGPVAGFTASPAYLVHLMDTAREMGSDVREIFKGLKYIMLVFQNYDPEWVYRVKEAWGGPRIAEAYGCSQFGSGVANTCGEVVQDGKRRMLHFFEDLCLLEVLDRETRRPVEFGEEGEVVLTSFARDASPVIRFAMSDRVRLMPHHGCDCGRPFNGFECGTIRRYDDMIKVRGINIWPQAVDIEVFKHKEVIEYQGRVFVDAKGNEEIEMTIEFAAGVAAERKSALLAELRSSLRERAGVRMELKESAEKLPRFEFKPVRWKDERKAGLQRMAF